MQHNDRTFQLQGFDEYSDEYAIQIAINVARRLLKVDDITPKQIIAIGKAIQALEKMPKSTPDVFIDFGISIDTPNEVRYLTFHISEDVFSISHGGAVDRGAGYDSYSLSPEWYIEIGGYRETKGNVGQIEDYIEAYLTDGQYSLPMMKTILEGAHNVILHYFSMAIRRKL